MIPTTLIPNLLFFDIETITEVEHFHQLSERKQELWTKRSEFLLKGDLAIPGAETKTAATIYPEKANLFAEFGKICCVTVGKIVYEPHEDPTILKRKLTILTLHGEEAGILNRLAKMLNGIYAKNSAIRLTGHNVREFDIPWLIKRMVINNIDLPSCLTLMDKKPWENAVLDTKEIWASGIWREAVSLDLLCECLGVQTPKGFLHGSKVNGEYWSSNSTELIAKYCEQDVRALAEVCLRLSQQSAMKEGEVVESKMELY